MKKFLVVGIMLWSVTAVRAQNDETIEDLFRISYETPLTIDINSDEELDPLDNHQKKKKKKKNPKIYYGIKTRRGFAKKGFGDRTVTEMFYMLKPKNYEGPDEFARDFYWYDFRKKKIVNSTKIKKETAGVMHGHYIKKMGDQVLEEGYFYKGTKHGRWVKYNRHDILQDKEYYWKGWPKESLLSFYDFERTNLREVIPVKYGEREGEYYAFHTNGKLAVVGHYKFDHKIGIWREYYDNARPKREVKYPLEPFEKDFKPQIVKEWDRDGHLIYEVK